MKRLGVRVLILGAGFLAATAGLWVVERAASARSDTPLALITIDYPLEGSIFPPEITAPTFLWRDASAIATAWRIDITFTGGSAGLHAKSRGDGLRIGEIDPRSAGRTNELPRLTPQQAAARSWKPDAETWAAIKKHSVERPATVTISGLRDDGSEVPVSRGTVIVKTSKDPVGAPIFYRDVPLMPSDTAKGLIKPLDPSALPLIGWRLRDIGQPGSRLIMEGLHTCANCHSFSRDGKTMGMDVDGPENDKGTYAIVPVAPQISIRNEDVITWNSFAGKPPGRISVGFLAQISPDGQYAVVTLNEEVYVANFTDYRFLQVFYPTRGILAWYHRATGGMKALPGADDPRYVQTDAVWSPDGKYLVFARAEARDAYKEGQKLAERSNDPNETPIQYDLYRIPFKAGKGGRPEPIAGASGNGMSNSFPKVSPDGRWIVFVKCRNGQLMRPDSQLYIVPAEGGQARRMECNTPLMNSWHSFSPNGRWLVFSSKSRSPYTQMFLTHLDEQGRDSPAILIENATAANRAVNIPEFVNIRPEELVKIDMPAAEFYRLFDRALELGEKGQSEAAIAEWRKALAIDPGDAKARSNLGGLLAKQGNLDEAIAQWRKAVEIKPNFADAHYNLGGALAIQGKPDEAVAEWRKTLEINPNYPEAHGELGSVLVREGKFDEANVHFQKALEVAPGYAAAHNGAGIVLAEKERLDQAIAHWRKAVEINPRYADALYNLGVAMVREGKYDEAIAHLQKALEVKPNYIEARYSLGVTFYLRGGIPEALVQWRRGLSLEPDYVPVLNQMSWVLATCSEASVRNGAEAVELAERAVRLSGGREPTILDALAAAYAEVGRFPESGQTARRALALAIEQNKQPLAEALRARIALYEAKTPVREARRN